MHMECKTGTYDTTDETQQDEVLAREAAHRVPRRKVDNEASDSHRHEVQRRMHRVQQLDLLEATTQSIRQSEEYTEQ